MKKTVGRILVMVLATALSAGTISLAPLQTDSASAYQAVLGSYGERTHARLVEAALPCESLFEGGSMTSCFGSLTADTIAGVGANVGAIEAVDINELTSGYDSNRHFDNTDSPSSLPNYGQNQIIRGNNFSTSMDLLKDNFNKALGEADRMKWASWKDCDLDVGNCGVAYTKYCNFVLGAITSSGRAKCNFLEYWGRVLHAVTDFYSHTNWADRSDPNQPISLTNPPGLGNTWLAPIGPEGTSRPDLPDDFTGGCYPDGAGKCSNRVTHTTLSKDRGLLDAHGNGTPQAHSPRGQLVVDGVSNFQRAATMAIWEVRRQWVDLMSVINRRYRPQDANNLICAIEHNNPAKTCPGHIEVIDAYAKQRLPISEPDPDLCSTLNAHPDCREAVRDQAISRGNIVGKKPGACRVGPLCGAFKVGSNTVGSKNGTTMAYLAYSKGKLFRSNSTTNSLRLPSNTDQASPRQLAKLIRVGVTRGKRKASGDPNRVGLFVTGANASVLNSSPVQAAIRFAARAGVRVSIAAPSGKNPVRLAVRNAVERTGGTVFTASHSFSAKKWANAIHAAGFHANGDPRGKTDGHTLVPGFGVSGRLNVEPSSNLLGDEIVSHDVNHYDILRGSKGRRLAITNNSGSKIRYTLVPESGGKVVRGSIRREGAVAVRALKAGHYKLFVDGSAGAAYQLLIKG